MAALNIPGGKKKEEEEEETKIGSTLRVPTDPFDSKTTSILDRSDRSIRNCSIREPRPNEKLRKNCRDARSDSGYANDDTLIMTRPVRRTRPRRQFRTAGKQWNGLRGGGDGGLNDSLIGVMAG